MPARPEAVTPANVGFMHPARRAEKGCDPVPPARHRLPFGDCMQTELFIGRQPLFDRTLQVTGYTLLHQGASDADAASHQVAVDALMEIGQIYGIKTILYHILYENNAQF